MYPPQKYLHSNLAKILTSNLANILTQFSHISLSYFRVENCPNPYFCSVFKRSPGIMSKWPLTRKKQIKKLTCIIASLSSVPSLVTKSYFEQLGGPKRKGKRTNNRSKQNQKEPNMTETLKMNNNNDKQLFTQNNNKNPPPPHKKTKLKISKHKRTKEGKQVKKQPKEE